MEKNSLNRRHLKWDEPPPSKDRQVKHDLLKAAIRLLSTLGREGATSRAICAEVGVGAPTMYHHYGDLAGLHKAAIDETFRRVGNTYRRSAKMKGPLQGIRESWTMLMKFAHEEPRMCRLVIQQILSGQIPLAVDSSLRNIAEDLANLKELGTLNFSPDYAAHLLWMGALGAICFTAAEDKPNDPVNLALQETMVEVILNSLFTKISMGKGIEPKISDC